MKKIILSMAIIAGIIATPNIYTVQAGVQPSVESIFEDDGFIDVRLEDLNEQVQQAVYELAEEYDIEAIKYSAEKQLTKVKLIKKDDQSTKTVYFNDEGTKVEKDKERTSLENQHQQGQELQQQQLEQNQQREGQELQREGQQLHQEGQQLQRESQELQREGQQLQRESQELQQEGQQQQLESQELQRESQELQREGQQQQQESQELQREGQEIQQQQPPSVEQVVAAQDHGFQNVKFEDLNDRVQQALREFANDYDITVLQYDNAKKITKVTGRLKDNQSEKTIHLNDEGKEVNLDEENAEEVRNESEETHTPLG